MTLTAEMGLRSGHSDCLVSPFKYLYIRPAFDERRAPGCRCAHVIEA